MLWAISCVDNSNTGALREQYMKPHRSYLDDRFHESCHNEGIHLDSRTPI
jgi:hypothetical protein